MMTKVLVLGATGATGRLVVQQFLQQGVDVVAIVRPESIVEQHMAHEPGYVEVRANVAELGDAGWATHLNGCDAVVCCLGHSPTFGGMFGQPRSLVVNAIENVARVLATRDADHKAKIVLMNSSGVSNRDIREKPPLSQRLVVALLRVLLPPHADNENAADFVRLSIGQAHRNIEWVVVRPDSLTDEDSVTEYDLEPSPLRNAIFDAGATSRINVANFMCRLVTEPELWRNWKGQMPVIYNSQV
ncbi:MAG: NAD(P)H-binding protein [Halioglobus sp.]